MGGLSGFAELVLLSWKQFLSHWDQDVATVLNTGAHLPGCDCEVAAKGSETHSGVLRLLEATGLDVFWAPLSGIDSSIGRGPGEASDLL